MDIAVYLRVAEFAIKLSGECKSRPLADYEWEEIVEALDQRDDIPLNTPSEFQLLQTALDELCRKG